MNDLIQYLLKSRHTTYWHIIMLETLRKCFENKDPIKIASRKAGTSDSTTRRYYAKWRAQRLKGKDYEYYNEYEQLKKRATAKLFKNQEQPYKKVKGLAKRLDRLKSELQNTVKS